MIKYRISLRELYRETAQFIESRSRYISGCRDFTSLYSGFEIDPENLKSLEDLKAELDQDRYCDRTAGIIIAFTEEIINLILTERFDSIPQCMANSFYDLARRSILSCSKTDFRLWSEITALCGHTTPPVENVLVNEGTRREDLMEYYTPLDPIDLYNFFSPLIKAIKKSISGIMHENTWLTTSVTFNKDVMEITYGEDMRHVVFEELYGGDWEGDYYLPDGSIIKTKHGTK